MNKDQAIRRVEEYLQRHQPSDFKLHVVPEATRQEDDWWYVCVRPDREGVRNYDYYDILARVERELQDDEAINILLIPAAPAAS